MTIRLGTLVTLTAAADQISSFTGWSGACSGTGTCEVTLSAAQSVTAGFTLSVSTPQVTKGQWEPTFSTPIVALQIHLLVNGKILLWGLKGEGYVWDPDTGTYTLIDNPYELFCTGHTFLPDGRLLVAGGHITNAHGLPKAAIFDPATNSWTLTGSMALGRWYPSVTTLPNGEVLTARRAGRERPMGADARDLERQHLASADRAP